MDKNRNHELLTAELYKANPEIALTPEYAYFIKDNTVRLLIRLSRYKFIAKMIDKDDTVLEIGCGSGLGTVFIGQHCKRAEGIDIDDRYIKEALNINRRDNVSFNVMDFFKLPARKNYDAIISLDMIEHLTEKRGKDFIAKTTRHIDKNGLLCIGTPSCYSSAYQSDLSKAAHIKLYDQSELVRFVKRYYSRVLAFSMNDEIVHTGHPKMAWYYFVLGFIPKRSA